MRLRLGQMTYTFQLSRRISFLFFLFLLSSLLSQGINAQPGASTSKTRTQKKSMASFNTIYSDSKCGLNYVQATIPLNQRRGGYNIADVQPASLNINGVPAGATIEKAYLYYNIEGYLSTDADFSFTLTNPSNLISTLMSEPIATGPTTCFEPSMGSATFRNDVTAAITGDGSYLIDGLPTSFFPADSPDANGASLFIIYSEANSTFVGTMIVTDGHEVSLTNGQNISCDITGFLVPSTVTNSMGFALIGDDQTFTPNQALLNGVSLPFIDGDAFTIAEGPINLSPGQTMSTHEIRRGGDDCFSLSMTGIYYQDSEANTCVSNQNIPTLGEWGLMILSLLLLISSIIKLKESYLINPQIK